MKKIMEIFAKIVLNLNQSNIRVLHSLFFYDHPALLSVV